MSNRIAEQLGEVGLPEPVAELAKRDIRLAFASGGVWLARIVAITSSR